MFDPLKVTDIAWMNREEINIFIKIGIYAVKEWRKFQKVLPDYLFLVRIFLEQTFFDDVGYIVFRDNDISKTVLYLVEHFRSELELW